MRFETLVSTPTAWTSVADHFALHLFEGHVSLEDMDRMHAIGANWNLEHPHKRVEMVIVFPSGARMTHEERVRMGRLIKLGEAHRTASATVILAEGLLASVQRSVLTGLMMLAPPPHPAKVFGSVQDAAHWLSPHVNALSGKSVRLDDALASHLAAFCARHNRPAVGALR